MTIKVQQYIAISAAAAAASAETAAKNGGA